MLYNDFNKEYEKKVYVSSAAEYKRIFTANYKYKVFEKREEVFNYLLKKFLKNVMNKDIKKLPELYINQNIGTKKKPVFIVKIENTEKRNIFAYRYKQGTDFYTIEIRVDQSRHNSVVRLFRTVKWHKTIIGVNGQMGRRDFNKKHKAESQVIENMTIEHFKK